MRLRLRGEIALEIMRATCLLIPAIFGATSTQAAGGEANSALDIIATAVRDRGFDCERPRSVERDLAASMPDREAWIIECDGVRYRVVFGGDTGPLVTSLNRDLQRRP